MLDVVQISLKNLGLGLPGINRDTALILQLHEAMIAGHNHDIAASDQPLHLGQDIAFDLVSNLIVISRRSPFSLWRLSSLMLKIRQLNRRAFSLRSFSSPTSVSA